MPSQTISAQSQSEISVTAQSSIPNRSDAEKRKATEVSDQDAKKTKLSVETRSHSEPHRAKANRVVCKHCKFDYSTVTVTTVLTHLRIARDYLGVPTTTTQTKRENLKAKYVATDVRNRLSSTCVQAMLCLK